MKALLSARLGKYGAWLACWLALALAASATDFTAKLAPLIDPAKLATLGQRGANPRIQKAVAILADAQAGGAKPAEVARRAVERTGYTGGAAELTTAALLRNLDIAGKLGCLDSTNLAVMRRGNSPTVRAGPYAGQKAAVDHIIPRAVVPALDNTIANLELLPTKLNSAKSAKVGARQLDLARQFHRAGLLDAAGLAAVERAAAGAKH
jgi:hypothetical protein